MFYSINLKGLMRFIKFVLAIFILAAVFLYAFNKRFPVKYSDIINKYSTQYDIPEELIYAVINAESGFDENAKSHRGASGLMQIIKQTADWGADEIGIENYDYSRILEPEINILIGCWYLDRLINQYGQNVDTALAAYNAGSGNVSGWLEEQSGNSMKLESIPFGETKRYVEKVNNYKKIYKYTLWFYGISHKE